MSDPNQFPPTDIVSALAFETAVSYARTHAGQPDAAALAEATVRIFNDIVAKAQRPAQKTTAPTAEKASDAPKPSVAEKAAPRTLASSTVAPVSAKPEPDAQSPTTATTSEPVATADAEVKYTDVAAAFLAAAKKNREGALALLNTFGASRAPDLKPEQWADFIAKANAL